MSIIERVQSVAEILTPAERRLVKEVIAKPRDIALGTAGELARLTPPRSTPKAPALAIAKPPFYALPIVPGITYTMGGIRIDGHARVLDRQGRPMHGLYAAGAATGGLEGGPRIGYVGGLVKSGVTGLRAAEHIASRLSGGTAMTDLVPEPSAAARHE